MAEVLSILTVKEWTAQAVVPSGLKTICSN